MNGTSGSGASAEAPSGPVEMSVNITRFAGVVLLGCVLLELGFLVLDYHVNYGKYTEIGALRRLTNIAREDSLASWFGTAQTLLVAVTLWFVYVLVANQPTPRWRRLAWLVIALFFSYMTVDDGAQIHERVGTAFRIMREESGDTLAYFPSYAWQLVFLPFFAGVGLFMFAFLWFELGTLRARIILVGAIGCMTLAVVLDFFEGLDRSHKWNLYAWLSRKLDLLAWTRERFGRSEFNTFRHFSKAIEEAIEMLANSLLWYLFIRHLGVVGRDIRLRLGG